MGDIMDPDQKKRAIKLLEYNDSERMNAVLGKVSGGEVNIAKLIQAIQAETAEGWRILGAVLAADKENDPWQNLN
ncbi:hypothetical protein KKD70_00360 [Patescibacteria group bacterium]|nr:hypothetical protein [Patescibacteria group bacterium]